MLLRPKSSSPLSLPLLAVLLLVCLLAVLPSIVTAQDDTPEPEPPVTEPTVEPTPSPSPQPPSDQPSISAVTPTPTTSASVAPPSGTPTNVPPVPSPIFSTSDSCVACRPNYANVSSCTSRLPPGNLTIINQVLPFYSCICADNGALIEPLVSCSICLRTTSQMLFFPPSLYTLTDQSGKAFYQVCRETENGSKIPSSGAFSTASLFSAWTWATVTVTVISLLLG